MLVFDNITKTMTAVAMARLDDDKRTPADLKAAYAEACRRVDMLVEQMATPGADLRPVDITTAASRASSSNRISRVRPLRVPSIAAWNTSAPATFFRSCSASD